QQLACQTSVVLFSTTPTMVMPGMNRCRRRNRADLHAELCPGHTGGALLSVLTREEARSDLHSRTSNTSELRDQEELLSGSELHRLTLFKWKYSLESLGFE